MITRTQYSTAPVHYSLAAGVVGQFLLLALLSAGVGLGLVGWLAGTGYVVASSTVLAVALHRTGTRSFGPADHVTLVRAVLVGGVTALVAGSIGADTPVAVFVALASVALALDAIDGLVARRTGSASAFGARFDMEVDAFLILMLSVHVAILVGGWVLAIGAMRYVFAGAGQVLQWLRTALPPSYARKAVAAVQGIVLVVAGAGVVPYAYTIALLAAALALLGWSFGRDIGWLCRAGRARRATPETSHVGGLPARLIVHSGQ